MVDAGEAERRYSGVPPEAASTRAATPFEGQKPGTSGLRKKTREFMQPGYLSNYVQSVFDCLKDGQAQGGTLVVAGDGRYFCDDGIKKIVSIAAGNGVGRVWIPRGGICTTPGFSAIMRYRKGGVCFGGFMLTASHNPGGIDADFGVKYDVDDGAPAPDILMNKVYERTTCIDTIKYMKLLDFDFDTLGVKVLISGQFKVEVVDALELYVGVMKSLFCFPALKNFVSSPDFSLVFDGMHGASSPFAKSLLVDELGAKPSCLRACNPLPDFGGHHPDPNLEYAKELVEIMHALSPESVDGATPLFGAACDGDGDRNMILGSGFFVTPSDSVAVISYYATRVMPFYMDSADGTSRLQGLGRSMPTSMALDGVAKKLGKKLYETPTGWKFFNHLMSAGLLSICGEESFGTGGSHLKEKDGLWAVLAWLSILAYRNGYMAGLKEASKADNKGVLFDPGRPLEKKVPFVSVRQIVEEFWRECGRSFYMRYDFEDQKKEGGNAMMAELTRLTKLSPDLLQKYVEDTVSPQRRGQLVAGQVNVFEYKDDYDDMVFTDQGIRLVFSEGRAVWRISGTGTTGVTIRMYFEKNEPRAEFHGTPTREYLTPIIEFALAFCRIKEFCGTETPTVVT